MIKERCEGMNWLRKKLQKIPRSRYGKQAFLYRLKRNAKVLDVGCGNNSPMKTKYLRPDIYYVGIDVGDYNQKEESLRYANKYILSTPEEFPKSILKIDGKFDAVISNHNLEHCNKPTETLVAMCKKLRGGAILYLAFPSEKSIGFPHREGTLNFYDDPTHIYIPKYDEIIHQLQINGMDIMFARKQYRPVYYFLLGCLTEPFSRKQKRVIQGTWAFWGFETVIWARKR